MCNQPRTSWHVCLLFDFAWKLYCTSFVFFMFIAWLSVTHLKMHAAVHGTYVQSLQSSHILSQFAKCFSNIGAMFYHICPVNSSWNLQDFTLDMYFRQFWRDPRLSFERRIGLEKLVVGAEYIKLIWVPDTFFVNEKTAYFHDATTENQFLRILHTGEILRSIRWVK